jgi:two-component system, HptB-dependent secretion and biofilm response regulator
MTIKLNKLKILAVDDNRTNLHILQVFLKKLGHEVILAENGEEAVRRFAADKPDLVLLDIMMPVMNGFEAARRIKAMTREHWTPIIFLSALNRDENLVEGLEAGGDDYLTKPINFVVLEAKLRSMQHSLAMQQSTIDALRRIQAISDSVIDALITINTNGMIATVNRATEYIFGWQSDELLGKNIRMLMPEPYHSQHDDYLASHLRTKVPKIIGQPREVTGLRKDGTQFPITVGINELTVDGSRMFVGVIRDISSQKRTEQTLRDNADLLQKYYDHSQSEQQLALRLIDLQLHRPGLDDPRLRYKIIAAENFTGDIVAANRSPEGRFYALLADATGHGLAAAISVLPVLAIFYRLTRRNHPVREIIAELNQQLRESIPVGRFVAATLVSIDEMTQTGEIWVGGTPTVFLIDQSGQSRREFSSENLPLGIVDHKTFSSQPISFTWEKENQLLIFSDGLVEATNIEGTQFGIEGLMETVNNTSPATRFVQIESTLTNHLKNTTALDDISLMLIDCP